MINIFSISNQIGLSLAQLKRQKELTDYRVYLRTNENLYAYILLNEKSDITDIKNRIEQIYGDCEIEFLEKDDLEDSFYQKLFSKSESINIETGRRRFDSLLDNPVIENRSTSLCPIATFYSYKGGMGRSTTLAAFAMHLAIHEDMNIMIIDCDFEAPGFTNFFMKNSGEENQRQGFVEYFLDKSINKSNKEDLEKYTWEASKQYSGKGSIRIMPAGNLDRSRNTKDFLKTDLNHYIEGLARIDFVHEDYIVKQYQELIEDLQKAFSPDIILIDSRTGFSDIMGITAFHLSQFVVGFFRNDAQSLPGLHFFLETAVRRTDIEPIIVNSILPQSLKSSRTIHNRFKEDVKTITNALSEDSGLDFLCFPISRDENLEVLGTPAEDTKDLIELIQKRRIGDYNELFENLADRIKIEKKKVDNNDYIVIEQLPIEDTKFLAITENTQSLKLASAPTFDEINKATDLEQNKWAKEIQNKILKATKEKFENIDLYAENIDIPKEYQNKQFFFRNCMNDIFNLDKVIILGSKGTGKSYIYEALKNISIVNELKKRAQKHDNYLFIYMIDKKTQIFKVNRFTISTKDFQYRFWLVYTWQILSKSILESFSYYQTSIKDINLFEIRDDLTTQIELEKIIFDNDAIIAIEKEMNHLDTFLIENGNGKKEYITLLYDQLDEIVEPTLWNDWLPSLIDFWRFKRYSRIYGKLFLRKDLFRKLFGVTNINDLENQAIDIEWSQEEMFAYFFKIVFSNGMDKWFWSQMYIYNDEVKQRIDQIRRKFTNLEQIPLDEYLLRPLATTFFGKYVDANKTTRMGESYDWFYKNLKNADDSISLRPFIELIKLATDNAIKQTDKACKPILYPLFYTEKTVRIKAVEKHFEDLFRNQVGNKPLEYIFEYITNNEKYQLITLPKVKFDKMLSEIIESYKKRDSMKGQTIETLQKMLIVNGIVKKDNFGHGDVYKFAYLYKYRLGLREKN